MAKTGNTTDESTAVLKELEQKMSSMMGIVDSLSKKVDDEYNMFVNGNSPYFLNISSALGSSLHESEMDRRLYEEAMEQNRQAQQMSGMKSPERGDSNFWSSAFTPTPVSQAEIQANVMKSAFSDNGVIDTFKNMFSGIAKPETNSKELGDIIKEAMRSEADGRTFGEKALDSLGFRTVTKGINWFADRDIRKEEKATAKDQGTIKREQKQLDRLSAKYRKLKASGASEEKLQELQEQYTAHKKKQTSAAERIHERRNDDLAEIGMPTKQKEQPFTFDWAKFNEEFKKIGANPAMQPDNRAAPAAAVSSALAPTVRKPGMPEIIEAELVDDTRTKDVTKDKNEPVELAKETKGALVPVGDTKEAADIQRKLDTTLRPDFYKEGINFFKKGNSGELMAGLSGALGGGALGGAAKAGLYAAAATAVVASVAKVSQAAMLVKDWYSASSEAVDNVKKMTEQNNANLEKRKNGVNDDMLTATQESNTADQELHESEESWADSAGSFVKDTLFGGLFGKSDRKKAQEKAAAAEKKRIAENEKYRKMKDAAAKAGVNTNDTEELKKFKELYDKGQADQYKSGKSKLAAGNLQESGQEATAQTPGSKVDTENTETAEEQAKRQEETMFNAMKRALLDIDVQRQNEENAKIQGKQIDQSLNGRK